VHQSQLLWIQRQLLRILLLTQREILVIQVAAYCASFSSYFIDFIIGDVTMFVKRLFDTHLFDVPQFLLYCRLEGQELTLWRWLLWRK